MATNNAANFTNPISVNTGGTGIATATAYAPVVGGTTSTGPFQQATSGFSTSGLILGSGGPSALPYWRGTVGMTKITTLTASASATLTFTSSDITSTYTRYFIEITQLVTSGGGTIRVAYSTNNGSSYVGSGYQTCGFRNAYNTATLSRSSGTAIGNITLLANATDTFNAYLFFFAGTGIQSAFVGRGSSYSSGSGVMTNHFSGGSNAATGVNNIQFSMSGGTFTTGTITLYGINS